MGDLDHRSLGNKLDLRHIQDDAPGMVFWHPRGYAVYRSLEDYIRRKMRRLGYAEVKTPQLLPRELWVRSGHWEKFGEHMFSMNHDGRTMARGQRHQQHSRHNIVSMLKKNASMSDPVRAPETLPGCTANRTA